jgi:hypothetical protein
VTTTATGQYPFYGPDGENGTLYLKSIVSGVTYWYAVNPSNEGDNRQATDGTVATLSTATTTQGASLTTLTTRVTTLELPGGTLDGKVTTMSGPRREWFRTFAEGLPVGLGEIDGDVATVANS